MTKSQFDMAFELARSKTDLSGVDDSTMCGCGLQNFKPVTITIEMAAKFLRWQCLTLTGNVDAEELNNCRHISKKKWLCV